jgi:DNA repair photolyase
VWLGAVRVMGEDAMTPRRHDETFAVLDVRQRGAKFLAVTAQRILNPPAQTGMDFWSLNPYVGCEFGCTYCYARYAHRYVVQRARDRGRLADQEFTESFEQRIFVKENVLGALEADLKRYFRTTEQSPESAPIVIGTATDPYQPAERRFQLTRKVLERLGRYEGLSIGLITKSPLVARDTDVLLRLQQRNDIEVFVSLIATDAALLRRLEARSPHPAARLRALGKLTAAGVNAGLIAAPVLPGITDDTARLRDLFRAAKAAGARFVHSGPLRLYPAIRDHFLPVIDHQFPALAARYARAYAGRSSAPRDYARALSRRIKRLQREFGFPVHEGMVDRYKHRLPALQGQLAL